MMFAHQITCAAFDFVILISPTEKFVNKVSTYIYLSLQKLKTNYCLN